MKNKKVVAFLAVCGLTLGMGAFCAQAKTLGIQNRDGTVDYYYCYPVEDTGEEPEQADITYRIGERMEESSEGIAMEVPMETDGDIEISEEIQKASPKTDEESVVAEEAGEATTAGTYSGWAGEESVQTDYRLMLTEEEKERESRRAKEYEKVGIEQSDQGNWIWNGQKIYFLLDDDGSIYSNGSQKAGENRIYVYVSRNEDGEVIKAETVEGKEALEKVALADNERLEKEGQEKVVLEDNAQEAGQR